MPHLCLIRGVYCLLVSPSSSYNLLLLRFFTHFLSILPLSESGSPTAARWGLSDFTLYITAFHNSVIWVSNNTNGFTMQRVRARVNAFFSLDDFNQTSRGRSAHWLPSQTGHLIDLHARNFEITDCDLYSTAFIINSQAFHCKSSLPGQCAGAQYGYVARNIFWNGMGGSHYMCLWQQVIFEQNVGIGSSLVSHGQAYDTGIGGYAQNVFNGDNIIRNVWGGDREVMTYDTESGSYFGPLSSIVNGTIVHTLHDTKPASYMKFGAWRGGALAVLNGTGAGQVRRIVVPGIDSKPSLTNRTWIVDRAFDIEPEKDDYVQIMAFRGRAIFFRNLYLDVGPVQLYTISLESVVAEIWAERFEGFVGFGQWRGWNSSTYSCDLSFNDEYSQAHIYAPVPSNRIKSSDSLKEIIEAEATQNTQNAFGPKRMQIRFPCIEGMLGIGMQPNIHSLYVDNWVWEGNTVINFNSTETQFYTLWYKNHKYVSIPIAHFPTPPNMFIVYRRNGASSEGGMWIGSGAHHVLVEGFNASLSSHCVDVDEDTTAVFVKDVSCTP